MCCVKIYCLLIPIVICTGGWVIGSQLAPSGRNNWITVASRSYDIHSNSTGPRHVLHNSSRWTPAIVESSLNEFSNQTKFYGTDTDLNATIPTIDSNKINIAQRRTRPSFESTTELQQLNQSVGFWYRQFRNLIPTLRGYLLEDNNSQLIDSTSSEGRKVKVKRKLKKLLLPLLLAYKLKFFTLIPVLIGGLVLLAGSTGMAGFFFALFAAVISLKTYQKTHITAWDS